MKRGITIIAFLCLVSLSAYTTETDPSLFKAVSSDRLKALQKKEALLKEILEKSEYIQFRDGSYIDLEDLEQFNRLDGLDSNSITNSIRAIEGGTGGGG